MLTSVFKWGNLNQDGDGSAVSAQRYEGVSQTVDLNLVLQNDVHPSSRPYGGTNFRRHSGVCSCQKAKSKLFSLIANWLGELSSIIFIGPM